MRMSASALAERLERDGFVEPLWDNGDLEMKFVKDENKRLRAENEQLQKMVLELAEFVKGKI